MKKVRVTLASLAVVFAFAGAFASVTSPDALLQTAYYQFTFINDDDQEVTECRQSETDEVCTIAVQNTRCLVTAIVPNRDAFKLFVPVTCNQPLYKTVTPP